MTKAKNAVCDCLATTPDCLAKLVFLGHSFGYAFDVSSEYKQFVRSNKRKPNPFAD